MITLSCDNCGNTFQRAWANKTRNFCCIECKYASERTTLTCDHCGATFTKKSSVANSARRFCCRACYLAYKVAQGRVTLECNQCGNQFSKQKWDVEPTYNFCSRKCQGAFQRKERTITPDGYVHIWVNGQRIREHRYVMEQHLGRPLCDGELVHHINEDPSDNRIENLQLVTPAEHVTIHWQDRKHSEQSINKMSQFWKQYWQDPVRSAKARQAVIESNKRRTKKA